MPIAKLFLDSSALFSGIASASGAARALLVLSETGRIQTVISEQVIVETERAMAKKLPAALLDVRKAILASKAQVVADPAPAEVAAHLRLISHAPDVSIVLAAIVARVDFLVTFNRRHFIDDPGVAQRSGLRVGDPGDALTWVRQQLATSG
jgi:predicted nucleic acid-binding protein